MAVKYVCIQKIHRKNCEGYPVADSNSYGLVKLGSGFTVGEDGSISVSSGEVSVSWDSITGKPTSFTPSSHTHPFTAITGTATTAQIPNLDTAKITTGVFSINRIPTGTTSTTVALGNHVHAISGITGLQTILDELDLRFTENQRLAVNSLVSPETDYIDNTEITAAIKDIIDALKAV